MLDRDGFASLSMRAVARELDMSTMGLYRYVSDRVELEQLIVEAVLGPILLEVPHQASWKEQVGLLVEQVRDAAGAHPETVPLLLAHRHTSPRTLQWIEVMLGVLASAGFTSTSLVIAQRTIVHYLLGAIQAEHHASLRAVGTTTMAELSSDDFPHLVLAARTAQNVRPGEEFRHGLNSVLHGLEATLNPDQPRPSRSWW